MNTFYIYKEKGGLGGLGCFGVVWGNSMELKVVISEMVLMLHIEYG